MTDQHTTPPRPEPLTDTLQRPFCDLRISVTDRCNFRCPYCMPAEVYSERYQFLPKRDLLTFEEITRVARVFVGLGARKIRLTGGEPLVRQEIETLVAQLAALDGIDDLAMTTNAYLLPQKAALLRTAGLQRLTISLDSLDNAVFRQMNGGRANVDQVLAGIAAAEAEGFTLLKINTVVQRGVNDHTLVDLARYFKTRGHIVRFIEYMDVGTLNGWRYDHVVPAKEIIARIHAAMPIEPLGPNYHGEVARRYCYRDGGGEIGVITSVTQPFCGDCTRLRLSAEGKIYTCLFATKGTDLRAPLRAGATDEDIAAILRETWSTRTDRYSELRTELSNKGDREKVEMFHIGG
ncbi:MAG: GTP 3',8-cyclase MoaA [Anaerolineae bacterium]|nr:GTP 3',8-cyclase MoaA [Anaerolineae bacterium]